MADTIKKLAIESFKSIMQSLARIRIEALIRKAGMGAIMQSIEIVHPKSRYTTGARIM